MERFPAILERDGEQGELADALRRSEFQLRPYATTRRRLVATEVARV
jgi:hypothetical protein